MFNKQGLNPAFAGNDPSMNLTAIYRSQWIGLEGAPTVIHLSGSKYIKNKNIGLGLNLTNITLGIESQLVADGMYAYKIRMKNGVLSGGLQLSYQNYKADFSDPRLVTQDGIGVDPALPSGMRSSSHINTGIGVYYNTEKYYVGLSSPRLITTSIDEDTYLDDSALEQHFYLMGGYRYAWNDEISITGQALIRYLRTAPLDFDLNAYVSYKGKYHGGLSYRYGGDASSIGESIDVIAGIHINENIFASIAYDFTLSRLRQHQSGSVEVLTFYRFVKAKKPEDFISPRFF